MYHVLLPVDGPDRADRQVETTLSLPGPVEATVLYVYEEIDAPAEEGGTAYVDEVNESLSEIRDRPDAVDRAVDRLAEAGVDATVREAVGGDAADAILDTAAELDVDAVVLAGRERSPVGKAVFGSVTQAVILEGDRPVVVAP